MSEPKYYKQSNVHPLYISSRILYELSCFILIDDGAYQEIPDEYEESDSPQVDAVYTGVSQMETDLMTLISQLIYKNCNGRIIIVY